MFLKMWDTKYNDYTFVWDNEGQILLVNICFLIYYIQIFIVWEVLEPEGETIFAQ